MSGGTIWKGYIHFDGTDVPVKLHVAVKEDRIQFHLLHSRDRVRLRQQMICAYEKLPVPTEEQVRGFEVEDGKYILIDPEEMEGANPERGRMIEVHEFVKTEQVDPLYRGQTYYLEPDVLSAEYNALVAAMTELNAEGICTWTMRKRSYFGALRAMGKILRLSILRYGDEVVSAKSLELEKTPVSDKELKIGSDLINALTGSFQPDKFEDEHQMKLRDLLEKKARGERIVILRPKRLQPTAPDKLLEALEASLKKVA